MLSNDHDTADLSIATTGDGPALSLDFPGLSIGVAEYRAGPTGCTVFRFNELAMLETDMRGGAIGVIGAHYPFVDAICLAGGSVYGLEATAGASAEIFAIRDHDPAWDELALVAGAIIYDYPRRDNAIYPDKALGRAAVNAARPGAFPMGERGAGCSAGVGMRGRAQPQYSPESSGQGGAFREIGPTKIAVFTVVNALGAIVNRDGKVVRGNRDASGERHHLNAMIDAAYGAAGAPGNTTLTVVVTNQRLDRIILRQLGRQIHTSMARAIQPFHTTLDGDVLFAVSTQRSTTRASATSHSARSAPISRGTRC